MPLLKSIFHNVYDDNCIHKKRPSDTAKVPKTPSKNNIKVYHFSVVTEIELIAVFPQYVDDPMKRHVHS